MNKLDEIRARNSDDVAMYADDYGMPVSFHDRAHLLALIDRIAALDIGGWVDMRDITAILNEEQPK